MLIEMNGLPLGNMACKCGAVLFSVKASIRELSGNKYSQGKEGKLIKVSIKDHRKHVLRSAFLRICFTLGVHRDTILIIPLGNQYLLINRIHMKDGLVMGIVP